MDYIFQRGNNLSSSGRLSRKMCLRCLLGMDIYYLFEEDVNKSLAESDVKKYLSYNCTFLAKDIQIRRWVSFRPIKTRNITIT